MHLILNKSDHFIEQYQLKFKKIPITIISTIITSISIATLIQNETNTLCMYIFELEPYCLKTYFILE